MLCLSMYSIYTGSIMTDRNANQTDQKYKIIYRMKYKQH
jgi:hypothetical protein